MDQDFVLANVDFLTQHLLDDGLRADLQFAVAGARAQGTRNDQTPATLAQKALEFLFFNPPNIFNLPPGSNGLADNNNPATTYDASIGNDTPGTGASGFSDAL